MSYQRPAGPHRVELEIKNSSFLALAMPVDSVDDAQQQLEQIRQQHPKANHHCWARICGRPDDGQLWSCSDDGEPRGTAGQPMLQVLQHSGLGQIQVVVVRYFGGIKLGTGGLVRAYSQSVQAVLETLPLEAVVARQPVTLAVPHSLTGELEQLIRQLQLPVDERRWLAAFEVDCRLTEAQLDAVRAELNRFSGQLELR
ncbi:YigZ family protein [Marinobacterium arenosum]|uniref:YigZ family protein n=1 Tax=Marinobacterium arenosum TaxID=2862496 RepID=UPI001C9817BB|nr:YigZ family protein [Marinobacterium arenosum]MBY4677800.1 YigZ family protein [Marinobacterium arenosum]